MFETTNQIKSDNLLPGPTNSHYPCFFIIPETSCPIKFQRSRVDHDPTEPLMLESFPESTIQIHPSIHYPPAKSENSKNGISNTGWWYTYPSEK